MCDAWMLLGTSGLVRTLSVSAQRSCRLRWQSLQIARVHGAAEQQDGWKPDSGDAPRLSVPRQWLPAS
jgi:hypothetical protein